MARITVEDCLDWIPHRNRFHLALLASRRARQLRAGATPLVQAPEDNFTVHALREIATGRVTVDLLDQVDRELEGMHAAEDETAASSSGEAAEALGAGIASGVEASASGGEATGEAGSPEEAGGAEEAPPEEPDITEGAPEQDLDTGEEDESGAEDDSL